MFSHRASLANGLFNGCKRESAIKFHMGNVAVVRSFGSRPTFTITPRDSSPSYMETTDILLAADGIKSKTHVELLKRLGIKASIKDTNQTAYRIMINPARSKLIPNSWL